MVRTKCCFGLAVLSFGAGMILSVLLQTGICAVILGLIFLVVGAFLLCGNGS